MGSKFLRGDFIIGKKRYGSRPSMEIILRQT